MDQFVTGETRVLADVSAVSRAATEETLEVVREALAVRGRCCIALAGGHTPEQMYRLWAESYGDVFPWAHIHLFWGDERYVPADDARSNYRTVRDALLDHVPLPAEHIHAMRTDFARPEDAAETYEAELRKFFAGTDPAMDVVFLGLGGEGHTASLFPASPALAERDRWVTAVRVPAEPPQRLTLTLPVLNAARQVFFVVTGDSKAAILHALHTEADADKRYPAAMIQPAGRLVWFLDAAAAGHRA